MENQNLKNRLHKQFSKGVLQSPLGADKKLLVPILRNKIEDSVKPFKNSKDILIKGQWKDINNISTSKQNQSFIQKQPKLLKSSELRGENRKNPDAVDEERLSKQAKKILQQGKIRPNLKPHDIFQFYASFPEMLEDFFYLNKASHPYDYQIVSYAQRNPLCYMTISSQGVTLFHDKDVEFLKKQEWLSDEKTYHSLQKIQFFKQYKLSKNFRIWKNRMRRHYIREMSGLLNEHLFLCFKYPSNCLIAVRKYTYSLRDNFKLLPYDQIDRLTRQQLAAILSNHRNHSLLDAVSQTTQAIVQVLQSAISQEICKFKTDNCIKIDSVNDKSSESKQEGYVYSQQAILKKQYKRVYKLIKTADCMLQQSKIQMIERCLNQLLQKIAQQSQEDKEPWLVCSASIDQSKTSQITWQPDSTALKHIFIQSVSLTINSLSSNNERISTQPVFTKYRLLDTDPRLDSQNLKTIIEESNFYHPLLQRLDEVLQEEFKTSQKQQNQLTKYINIYQRHRNLQSMNTIFNDNNAIELCNLLQQWKNDEKQMSLLPEYKKGRLLLFNYSQLRKAIVSVPKNTLAAFFSLLPDHTSNKSRELIQESKSLLQMISVYPTEIVSFARFNKAVKQASERLEQIKSAGSEICLLIEIMNKHKLPNIELYQAKKIQTLNSITNLKLKVEQSQVRQNESLSKFKKENQVDTNKIKTAVKQISSKFHSIDFAQLKSTTRQIRETLFRIRQIMPLISSLENQSNKIQQIQGQLNLPQTDFNDVHQLYQNVQVIHQIWSCKDQWKVMLLNLYHQHYLEVDCVQLKTMWEQFYSRSISLSKTLADNQNLKQLVQQIAEVQVLIQTIIALRSPNLEQKSWKQISEYLAYQLGYDSEAQLPFANQKNQKYTVKWLLQINIPLYKEKIQFIVKKSEKEKQLSIKLSQIKNFLANLNVETISKKREVYILAQNSDLKLKLEENLNCLYSIIDNQFSLLIKQEAEILIRQYEYVEEIMQSMRQFGNSWEKIEGFFEPSSSSLKLLSKQAKEFNNWEIQWKKIMKNVMTESIYFYKKVCDETTGVNCSRSLLKQINKVNSTIEFVRKGLEEYLDKKRASFHRYYFFSDQQLIQILVQIDQKQPITSALVPIIYQNINCINYKKDTKDTLISIISKQGQQFPLKNVGLKSQVDMEENLKFTEEQIKKRINHLIKHLFLKYTEQQITRTSLILENNAQVVLAIDFIAWVRLAEQTYLTTEPLGDLYDWLQIQNQQIQELAGINKNPQPIYTYFKLMQMMTQSLYFREKTQQLLKLNVTTTDCYQWERIPRLVLNLSSPEICLKQLSNSLNYTYEFLGNSSLTFIAPQTERVWLNVAQAINNKQIGCLTGDSSYRIETMREIAYVIAQWVEFVHPGNLVNFKMIQRYFNGAAYIGNWVCFNAPQTTQMLSFLANQILTIRKTLLQYNNNSQSTKSVINVNPNTAFFISMASQSPSFEYLPIQIPYRSIHFLKPNLAQIMGIISECEGFSSQVGIRIVNIVQIIKNAFSDSYCAYFSYSFIKKVYMKIKQMYQVQAIHTQILDLNILDVIDKQIVLYLSKQDNKIYEAIKSTIIINYDKIKAKQNQKHNRSIHRNGLEKHHLKSENIDHLIAAYNALQNDNIGTIIVGEPLSGKSTLVKLTADLINKEENKKIKIEKMYPNAYKKEQFQGTDQKSIGIFALALKQNYHPENQTTKWVILDGNISNKYMELFTKYSQKYIFPQIGLVKPNKHKIILQTSSISNFNPSIISTHTVVNLSTDVTNSERPIRQLFQSLASKRQTSNLLDQSVEYLISQLSTSLNKLQTKGNLKSRLINFIYPFNNNQIIYRCCKTVESVFAMNWESIREKEKNMKKIIEKFVAWAIYWSLYGLVLIQDISKFDKYINELCKTQNCFTDELRNYIVYPSCGLEVQLFNGLRTQSSLSIPQKDILTNLMKTNLQQNPVNKTNKFYEEIIISEPNLIRVNCYESNRYSYSAQLASYNNVPTMLFGPANSGKKSIIELYAKNLKAKSQFYSIRFMHHLQYSLLSQIQKPFRKLNSLKGILLKSVNPNKKLIISIEDISLTNRTEDSNEALRMLFNQKGIYNRQTEFIGIKNCSFGLISNRIIPHQVNRLLPRMNFYQTNTNSIEKLQSIYSPYLKNWSNFNGLTGQISKLFCSQAGDSLLDATLSIFKLSEELYQNNSVLDKHCLDSLLLKPRIGDISKVLTYICKTPDAGNYNLTYYYELWTHQVMRVFCDRVRNSAIKQIFLKQIKKQALLKFKENFDISASSLLMFSSLGIENDNCYIRIQDVSYIHTYISNLLQAQQITLPLKFLFNELLQQIIRIHRIMAIENSHLLMLSCNKNLNDYLIQLACQISQNDYYHLRSSPITVNNHIEPALFYRDHFCITENIQDLSSHTIYQISCLINGNHFDLHLTSQLKEKLKSNLRKQNDQKKDEKNSNNRKNDLKITEVNQKQQDFQIYVQQQFMNYCHFVFQATPTSEKLKLFLQNEVDIVGQLYYNWSDIPQQSIFIVAKQILAFDSQQTQTNLYDDDKLIEQVKVIYNEIPENKKYFNNFFTICEIVKNQHQKLQQQSKKKKNIYTKSQENMKIIRESIKERENQLKLVQNQLQQIALTMEEKISTLEDVTQRITELQISSNEEYNDNLSQQRILREQLEIEIKVAKERKEKLQPQKKNILKNIKIGTDYIQLFNNQPNLFISKLQQCKNQIGLIKEKLIIAWATISFLSKQPTSKWLEVINKWILTNKFSLSHFNSQKQLLSLFNSLYPIYFNQDSILSDSLQLKTHAFLYSLVNYQDSINCQCVPRVQDPKGIIYSIIDSLNLQNQNQTLSIAKVYKKYSKDIKSDIENVLKSKNGLIWVIDFKETQLIEIQKYLLDRKMMAYFNKIVFVTKQNALFTFQTDQIQLQIFLKNLAFKQATPYLYVQKKNYFEELYRELRNQRITEQSFYQACSSIDIQSQTYTQQITKIKNSRMSQQGFIQNLKVKLCDNKYQVQEEIQITKHIIKNIKNVWSKSSLTLNNIVDLYRLSKKLKNEIADSNEFLNELDSFIQISYTSVKQNILYVLQHTWNWNSKIKVYLLPQQKKLLNKLQKSQLIKAINLLQSPHSIEVNHEVHSYKLFYNYIQHIHYQYLNDIIQKAEKQIELGKKGAILLMCADEYFPKFERDNRIQVIQLSTDTLQTNESELIITEQKLEDTQITLAFQNYRQYLKISKSEKKLRQITELVVKNLDSIRNIQDLGRLINQFDCEQSLSKINYIHINKISNYSFDKQKLAKADPQQKIQSSTQNLSFNNITIIKQELPFLFNIAQFLQSKDPFASELLLQCTKFNKKLKKIKDQLRELQMEINQECSKPISSYSLPSQDAIMRLNLEHFILKKSLTKMHMLTGGNINSTYKINSFKALSQMNLIFNQVLPLTNSKQINKLLVILKCRAAKKLKVKLQDIGISWRVCSSSFTFEQCSTQPDLCGIFNANIKNGHNLQLKYEDKHCIQIIACPFQINNKEVKPQQNNIQIPLTLSCEKIGFVEISKTDCLPTFNMHIDEPEFVLNIEHINE